MCVQGSEAVVEIVFVIDGAHIIVDFRQTAGQERQGVLVFGDDQDIALVTKGISKLHDGTGRFKRFSLSMLSVYQNRRE